jgi:hypothetical protein
MTSSAENVRDTLVRLQERLAPDRLAALREIHSSTGKHELKGIPFTDWVPAGVSEEARLIVGRSFWFRWLVTSAVGIGVGVVTWVSVGTAAEAIGLTPQSGFSRALIPALVGAAFGAPFGIAQWIVLRRHLRLAGRWVTATTLGYAAVFLLRLVLGDPSFVLGPIVAVALSGIVMVWLLRGERQ